MVRTVFPATSSMEVRQEKIRLPFMRTVHAPQRPSPQPYLAPVSWNSSRSRSRRVRPGSVWTDFSWPLTVNLSWSMFLRVVGINSTLRGNWDARMVERLIFKSVNFVNFWRSGGGVMIEGVRGVFFEAIYTPLFTLFKT